LSEARASLDGAACVEKIRRFANRFESKTSSGFANSRIFAERPPGIPEAPLGKNNRFRKWRLSVGKLLERFDIRTGRCAFPEIPEFLEMPQRV
jgi:hypothetical protein